MARQRGPMSCGDIDLDATVAGTRGKGTPSPPPPIGHICCDCLHLRTPSTGPHVVHSFFAAVPAPARNASLATADSYADTLPKGSLVAHGLAEPSAAPLEGSRGR